MTSSGSDSCRTPRKVGGFHFGEGWGGFLEAWKCTWNEIWAEIGVKTVEIGVETGLSQHLLKTGVETGEQLLRRGVETGCTNSVSTLNPTPWFFGGGEGVKRSLSNEKSDRFWDPKSIRKHLPWIKSEWLKFIKKNIKEENMNEPAFSSQYLLYLTFKPDL